MQNWRMMLAAAGALMVPATVLGQTERPDNAIVEPTCADLMAGLRVADAGDRPSRERKAAAERAQDDIATALFWLHGWHHAKGQATLPVTKDWMVAELKRVVEACRTTSPDGAMRISQVATQ